MFGVITANQVLAYFLWTFEHDWRSEFSFSLLEDEQGLSMGEFDRLISYDVTSGYYPRISGV